MTDPRADTTAEPQQTGSPVFVVGAPRSGTTLLASMLNAHSDVSIAPEIHYFTKYWERLQKALAPGGSGAAAAVELLLRTPEVRDMHLRADEEASIRARLTALGRKPGHDDIYLAFVLTYAARAGKTVYGEKTPAYLMCAETLDEIFPGSRFLCIVRDPRDVSLSWRSAGWRGGPVYHALFWRRFYRAAQEQQSSLGARFLLVGYEDLLADPRGILTRCCEFLGVQFEDGMLAYHSAADPNFDAAREPWKAKATTPLDPKNADKWRTELPAEHVAVIQRLLHKEIRDAGYEIAPTHAELAGLVRMVPTALHDVRLIAPRVVPAPVVRAVGALRRLRRS